MFYLFLSLINQLLAKKEAEVELFLSGPNMKMRTTLSEFRFDLD